LLAQGQTDGIFQFESAGMKKYLMELKPNQFEDLIAMVALYRPGPMQFISSYIARKYGREEVKYAHPLIESVLKETYGVTVYQEQVMQISRDMGGFTRGEADTLRKAMGKKNLSIMEKFEKKFKDGAKEKSVPAETANQIWEEWKKFAEYAFNKSHSTCYALVAFQTAYLKAHYPVEFMAALLSLEDDPAKIPYFMDECRSMGIEVIPPNINQSEDVFSVHGKRILFGLRGIKNVGEAAVQSLVAERHKNGIFKSIYELCTRVDTMAVNKTVLESLVAAGAMDDLEGNRAQNWHAVENVLEFSASHHREKKRGQMTVFDLLNDDQAENAYLPELPAVAEWTITRKLEMEKNVLGFYLSGHPLHEYKDLLDLVVNAHSASGNDIDKIQNDLRMAGVVADIRKKRDAKGNSMAFIMIEDFQGRFELTLFGKDYEQFFPLIEEGKFLFVFGKKSTYTNGDENLLRVIPKMVLPLTDLPKRLKGEFIIALEEKNATGETASRIKTLCNESSGLCDVIFNVKTAKFKWQTFPSRTLKIYPDSKLVTELRTLGLQVTFKMAGYA
jgi:DNA polymerase-3 subunit alpha